MTSASGIPIRLLYEAESMKITVEVRLLGRSLDYYAIIVSQTISMDARLNI